MKLYKYTPALLDPKTLEDTLIGRDLELDNLKRILKSASAGKSFSHAILVGPKGIGKSHLLRILYHAIGGEIKTKGLNVYKNKFIPVIFSEEEYPSNITKFINLTLTYLSDSGFADIPPIPEELIKPKILNLKEREVALDYLRTFKKKTGKILLLLVDNINDIMERFTDEEQSSLREVLMTYDSVLLVGSAPTLFDSIINHKRPFYNFFETIWLKDLSFEDTVSLLKRYAELDERNDLIEKFDESEAKLKALHELAGGNPRLILCLYHIIAEGDITSVEETFLKLLDELSPYFRERIRDLSEQQKEIIDVMAKAEGLLTPTEIAIRCYMPVNTVLSQIKRLEKVGCIKISKKLTKKVFYDFNERLFSLWRQMRVEAGRKRLGFIVKFLEVWFTKAELFTYLDKTFDAMRKRLTIDNVGIQHDIDRLWYIKEALPEYKGRSEICVACERKDYDVALGIIDKTSTTNSDDVITVNQMGCKYHMYMGLKKYDEALELCKKTIEKKPDLYDGWVNLGTVYMESERYIEAIEAYKKAVEISCDSPEISHTWYNLSFAYYKLQRYDEAVEACRKVLEISPEKHEAWGALGITYTKLNKHDEAIESYKKAIGIKPDTSEIWRMWNSLGDNYFYLKKYDEAVEAFKQSVKIKPANNCAWYYMGHAYLSLQKLSDALEAFKKASEVNECDHYDHLKWFVLWVNDISLFINEGIKGNTDSSIESLKGSLNHISYLTPEKEEILDSYARAFKNIIKAKKTDVIKAALKEIEVAHQNDLLEFLSTYVILIKYLETKNNEIIDRLRSEERIVVEDMLKMLEDKINEKTIKRNK